MFDLDDIWPIEDFIASPRVLISRVQETGRAQVLIREGRPDLVLVDARTFQEMQGARQAVVTFAKRGAVEPLRTEKVEPIETPTPRTEVRGDIDLSSVVTFASVSEQQENHNDARGAEPVSLSFPDGSEVTFHQWKELSPLVLKWLSARHQLPVPFCGRTRGAKLFLAREPHHADGKPFDPIGCEEFNEHNQRLWIDTKRSAWDTVRSLTQLVAAVREDPNKFIIRLRSK